MASTRRVRERMPRAWLPGAMIVALLLGTRTVAAALPRVTLGEVSVAPDLTKDLVTPLRSSIEGALSTLDWRDVPRQKRFVLSVALVRLDARSAGSKLRVSCVVSAVLREARSGNVLAIAEGRAASEAEGENVARWDQIDSPLVRAAAESAVAALPAAVRTR